MALQLGSISAALTLDISQFTGNAKQAESVLSSLEASGDRTGGMFGKLRGTALGIGDVLALPFTIGVKAAADLEQNLANLNASLGGLDARTLDSLADAIQDIGAASKYSANDVALVADELAKAGYTAEQLTSGTLQTVVDLAQATGESLETATSGVVQAMAMWSPAIADAEIAMTDVTRAADIFTVAANQSAGGVSDIIAGLRPLGPVASSMGVGFDEASAAIALFTQYGLSGAEAGISLARGLTNLADPTSEAATLMDDLGIAAFDTQGNFVGFPSLFDQLNKSMGDMSDQAQLTALSTIFGAEAMDVMGLAILSGSEPLEAMIGLMQEQGVAAEQSALRMDTLSAQWDSLKEGAVTLLASFAGGLIPVFRAVVDVANDALDVFSRIPDPIKQVIGLVGGSLAMFSIATRAIQGFQAMQGLLTALGGGATAASFSFGALASGIGLVVAALAGLTIAYSYNFLGFRDFVGKVVDGGRGILNFFRDLKTGWDGIGKVFTGGAPAIKQATSPLSALGRALGGANGQLQETAEAAGGTWEEFSKFEKATYAAEYALGKLIDNNNAPKWLRDTAKNIRRALPNIRNFGNFLGDLWSGSPRKAMESLELLPPRLQKIAKNIAPAVTGVRDLVDAFQVGGFSSLVREIPQSFDMIGDSIRAFVSDMTGGLSIKDWALDVAAPKITGWLADIASDVWDGLVDVAGWAWDGLVQLGAWVLNVGAPAVIGAATMIWNAVSDWVTGTAWPAVQNAAITVFDVLLNIGSWASGVAAAILPRIAAMAQDAWDLVKTAAITIWDVATNIGSWAAGTAQSIWPRVAAMAQAAWDLVKSGAVSVWDAIVNIGSWAAGTAQDIWPRISAMAQSAWELAKEGAVAVWGVTVNVGSWIAGTAVSIWPRIAAMAADAWDLAKDLGASIWDVLVNIGSFAQGEVLEPIGDVINEAVLSAYDAYVADGGFTSIPDVPAKIEKINVETGEAEFVINDEATLRERSIQQGTGLADKIIGWLDEGVNFVAGTNGGAGGGSQGGVSLMGSIDTLFTTVSGWFQGGMDRMIGELENPGTFTGALGNVLYAAFVAPFVDLYVEFEPAIQNLIAPLKRLADLDFSGITSGLGDIWDGFEDMMNLGIDMGPVSDAYDIFKKLGDLDWSGIKTGIDDFGGSLGDLAGKVLDFGWITDLTNKLNDLADAFLSATTNKGLWDGINGKELNPDEDDSEYIPGKPVTEPDVGVPAGGTSQLPQSVIDALGGESGDGGALGRALSNAKIFAETKMREIDTAINTGLTTTGTTITTGVAAWGTSFGTALQPILTVVNAVFVTAIPANITTGMSTATTAVTSGTAAWTTAFAGSLQPILTLVNATFVTAIPANVQTGMTAATGAIDSATSRWQAVIQSSTRAMQSATASSMQAMVSSIASAMTTATGRIQSETGRWPNIVSGTTGSMRNAGYGAGAAAGDGVVNGLLSRLGAVRSAANEIARTVDAAIAKSLQIHSPSRVTYELGRQTGIGFANGISDQVDMVAASTASLTGAVKKVMAEDGSMVPLSFYDKTSASGVTRRYPVDPTTGEVYRPGHPGPYPDNLIWPDGMSKDIGTVIGDRVSDVIRDTSPAPDTNTTTPKPEREPDWKDYQIDAVRTGMTDALERSGLGVNTSVSTLWNEQDWLARVEKLGLDLARNPSDLFEGRTRLNDTDYLLLDGKLLEHYGSPVVWDPTSSNPALKDSPPEPAPPPDVPNNGSASSGYRSGHAVPAVQQTTQIFVTADSDQFSAMAANAKRGHIAAATLSSMGTRRTASQGVNRPLVRG